MKVIHICIVAYIDGWGYQDNLLPEYMAIAGHEVVVVSSSNHFPSFLKSEEVENIKSKGGDYYCGNVHVYRIPVKISTSNYSFYCSGLMDILKKENPDVIFHHGVNSSTMIVCWLYAKCHHTTKLFIDSHADFINESSHRLWNLLITRGLMKICVKVIRKKIRMFYGVSPGRCDYLNKVYGVPVEKVSLLPIGCDSDMIDRIGVSSNLLREKYNIPSQLFVIISGGKMGKDKGTDTLIKVVDSLRKKHHNIGLVLFGSFTDSDTKKLAESYNFISYQGWCNRQKTLELLKSSDIACWPVHHTTLIEDAIGCSVPIVVRETGNTSHLVDSNGEFVANGVYDELLNKISMVINNYNYYKENAFLKKSELSYNAIVKQIEKDCV